MNAPSRVSEIVAASKSAGERHDAERARLDRLIRRHQKAMAAIPHQGGMDLLDAVFGQIVARMEGIRHEVSGPYGMAPEYYVTLRRTDGTSAACMLFRGGGAATCPRLVDPEDDGARHSRALPDDLDDVAALVEGLIAEERLRQMTASAANQ